jgi:hypothetical protein
VDGWVYVIAVPGFGSVAVGMCAVFQRQVDAIAVVVQVGVPSLVEALICPLVTVVVCAIADLGVARECAWVVVVTVQRRRRAVVVLVWIFGL